MTGFENFGVFIWEKVWLRLFSNQTFPRTNNPTFSNLVILHTYAPMKMEQTECSETLEYKIQTPGNYAEESIKHKYYFFGIQKECCEYCKLYEFYFISLYG
jgi:hypothetical protein